MLEGKMSAAEYERIAAEAAGLVPPAADADMPPPVGDTAISDTPAALDAVVNARLTKIREAIEGAGQIDFLPSPAFDTLVAADFLTYSEYRAALAKIDDHRARFDGRAHEHKLEQLDRKAATLARKLPLQEGVGYAQTSGELARVRAEISYLNGQSEILPHEIRLQTLCLRYNPNRFFPTREGYLAYLMEVAPTIFKFSERRLPAFLPEVDRQAHTYITGKSGSGKSELLKVLIHSYARDKYKGSVVVIDPHGDFAEQVACFPEIANSGRLIYINPDLSPYYSPTINPFDIQDRSIRSVAIYTEQIIKVFERLFTLSGYGELTGNMVSVLQPCIATLLRTPGSTLRDLILFMDDNTNERLANLGLHSPDEDTRLFFANRFGSKSYESTRAALGSRIQLLLSPPILRNFLIGKNTIDLESEVNKGKFIIFALPEGGGKMTMPTIGSFIIAMLQGMAMRRYQESKSSRVPVHLFIDECQYFLTDEVKTILTGARKFGLHLTLAQQQYGQGMDAELAKTVLGNTAVKIVGMNDEDTLKKFEDRLQVSLDDLRKIEHHRFYIKTASSNKPAVKVSVPSRLVGFKNSIGVEAWKLAKKEQMRLYYRKLETPTNHVGGESAGTPDLASPPGVPAEHATTSPAAAPRRTKAPGTGKAARPAYKPLPEPPEGEFV